MTRVIACCDGLDPAYLDAADTPGWDAIAADGTAGTCDGVVPSVTNVNNVSIVTGAYPETHGVTANTYFDRERGERVYMEDPSFLRSPTRLAAAVGRGETAAALVVKDKLRGMVGRGIDLAASAEDPPAWLEDAVGPAPDIYSGDASAWVLDAAAHVLSERAPDWLYVSTTDVVPHKHAPGEEAAREWVSAIDEGLAALADRASGLVATADHGMGHKTRCVDLEAVLADAGIEATVIRLIRDRHVYHHQNLGGAAYVYLADGGSAVADAREVLAATRGVDRPLAAEEAAARYRLAADRIGDLLVLGAPDAVFGPVDGDTTAAVDLRSHGSHHEATVPYAVSEPVQLGATVEAFDALA